LYLEFDSSQDLKDAFKYAEGKKIKGKRPKSDTRNTNEKQNNEGCAAFYENAKGYRFDQNALRQVKRIEKTINKLGNKKNKAATAFNGAAEFFRDCPDFFGFLIYNVLSQCPVTAAAACNIDNFFAENPQFLVEFEAIDDCKERLTTSTSEADECVTNCPTGDCNYVPVKPDCRYTDFDAALKLFNANCLSKDVEGTFSYCTSLLKESYNTASICCSAGNSAVTTENPTVPVTFTGPVTGITDEAVVV